VYIFIHLCAFVGFSYHCKESQRPYSGSGEEVVTKVKSQKTKYMFTCSHQSSR